MEFLSHDLALISGRVQSVSLDGLTSHPLPVRRGVPQGFVLGPILFLLYINDLVTDLGPSVHPVLFADDSEFFITGRNLPSVVASTQTLLNRIQEWCLVNCMAIKIKKSQVVLFRTPYKKKWSSASTWPKIFYQSPPTGSSQVFWCPHWLLPIICNTRVLDQSHNFGTGKYD